MRKTWIAALALVLPVGCDGGGAQPTEAKHLELTDAEKAEIEKADRSVEDEEQGRNLTQPKKSARGKKG